jgi:hypothetical protein
MRIYNIRLVSRPDIFLVLDYKIAEIEILENCKISRSENYRKRITQIDCKKNERRIQSFNFTILQSRNLMHILDAHSF